MQLQGRCRSRSSGAVHAAVVDQEIKVIVLRGAGRAFSAGADFGGNFDYVAKWITTDGEWDPGKDMTFFQSPAHIADPDDHEYLARS